jgi:biopolymer transport protein ExbB
VGALLQWFELGGVTLVVLGLVSIAGLTVTILKLWDFSERRIADRSFVQPALDACLRGRPEQAQALLAPSPSPLAGVLAGAIATLGDARLDDARARERIERAALDALEGTRSHLRTLEVIGSLAPLLGLLGTVLGMIDAFQALEAAGDRVEPAVLSAGIWHALITTAAGLIIAIPAIALVNYFERRIEGLQQAMESALTQLLTAARRGD